MTNRQPKGVPTGGEFATGARVETPDLEMPSNEEYLGEKQDPYAAEKRAANLAFPLEEGEHRCPVCSIPVGPLRNGHSHGGMLCRNCYETDMSRAMGGYRYRFDPEAHQSLINSIAK